MSPLCQLNGLSGRDLPGTGRSKPVILVPVTESDYFNWYVMLSYGLILPLRVGMDLQNLKCA